jgi:hypothetical protein
VVFVNFFFHFGHANILEKSEKNQTPIENGWSQVPRYRQREIIHLPEQWQLQFIPPYDILIEVNAHG